MKEAVMTEAVKKYIQKVGKKFLLTLLVQLKSISQDEAEGFHEKDRWETGSEAGKSSSNNAFCVFFFFQFYKVYS